MRMCLGGSADALVIMTNNDVLQTKFIGYNPHGRFPSPTIGDSFHIVIDNVWTNMGNSTSDVMMNYNTGLHINDDTFTLWCTWTSIIKPDNVTVELNCEVVETNGSIVTAKCYSETTWDNSVFNRIPIYISSRSAIIGKDNYISQALFNTYVFSKEGSITQKWDGSTRYNVTGSESNLTINDQVTIKDLPTDFVNHWVNMGAEALMGGSYVMLVPPNDQ